MYSTPPQGSLKPPGVPMSVLCGQHVAWCGRHIAGGGQHIMQDGQHIVQGANMLHSAADIATFTASTLFLANSENFSKGSLQ